MAENVRSESRIFDILEILARQKEPVSLTEIARGCGLSKATAFRLIQTMCNRGYAEKDAEAGYMLGPKIMEITAYHVNALELQTVAQPFLSDLYADLHLTVHLGKLVGVKVVYLDLLNQNRFLKNGRDGLKVDAYTSSIGKCLLSCESGDVIDYLLSTHKLKRYTAHTITDSQLYKEHLGTIRKQGWAMDDCEFLDDRRCVGAPVFDYTGSPIACVSVSGSVHEITDAKLMAIVVEVKETAGQISQRMGYVA